MVRKVLTGSFAVVVGLVAFMIIAGSGGEGAVIERTGYFKDDERYRVMAFRSDVALDRAAAEAALAGVMHSTGAATWAVIYGPGAREPGHLLTNEESRAAALEMIMSPPFDGWSWYLTIRHDGQRILKSR